MARPKKSNNDVSNNDVTFVQDNVQPKQAPVQIEDLKEQINKTIELCAIVMETDRSKVMRLKGLKRQLEDVLRKIV